MRTLRLVGLSTIAVIAIACSGDGGTGDAGDDASHADADVTDAEHDSDGVTETDGDTRDADDAVDTAGLGDAAGAGDTGPADAAPEGEVCAPECAAGAARCDDEGRRVACEVDATGCTAWGAPTPCGDGDVCQAGACVPPCGDDDTRCLDAERLQRCAAGVREVIGCAYGCDPTTETCRGCPTGGWRCADDGAGAWRLEACPTGMAWTVTALCGACGCTAGAAGVPVVMQCLGQDDTATACAACGDDGLGCTP